MSDWIRELAVEEARKAREMNGGRPFDTADLEQAMRSAVAANTTICSICRQVAARPDLRGTMWRKDGGVSISFSATVVQMAGGIDRLLSEWIQVDPSTLKPL